MSQPRCERRSGPGGALLVAAAAAALLGAAGCGSHYHVRLGTRAEPEAFAPRTLHGPEVRVLGEACRAIDVTLAAPGGRAPSPGDEAAREHLVTGLAEALHAGGAFERVTCAIARPFPHPGAPPVTLEWRRGSIRPTVYATGVDTPPRLRLEVTLGELEVHDLGTSVGAVIGYLFLGPWTDWWHDVPCRVTCPMSAVIRDAESGRLLGRLPRLTASAEEELSFFERRGGAGPTIATFFWIPPMAFDTDERRVLEALAPRSMEEPAREVTAAVARIRARSLEATYARVFPQEGLSIEIKQPKAGPVKVFTTVALRLSGARLSKVRTVWIGDQVVFDASKKPLAKDATEAILGRPVSDLEQGGPLLVFAQMAGGDPPVAIAEVGVAKRVELSAP